jgi:hypothetical protein
MDIQQHRENAMDNRLYYMLAKAENAMTVYIKKQLSRAGLKA